jgi:predicted glycogen debranching enzyme
MIAVWKGFDLKNTEWLLTNGLGSYCIGSADESMSHPEHALFTVLLRPPLRREKCVRRLHETIYLENSWQALAPSRMNPEKYHTPGFTSQFELENHTPCYTYTHHNFVIQKRLFMEPEIHVLYVQYCVVRAEQKCRLRIQPLLILPTSYFDAAFLDSPLQIHENGFAFNFEHQEGKKLYFSSNVASRIVMVNNWMATELALAQSQGREVNYIPAALSLVLQPGESATIRIGLEPAPNFDAEQMHKSAMSRFVKKKKETLFIYSKDKKNTNHYHPHDFIIERATANVLNSKTILAGYPARTDDGRSTLLALPGLLLTAGEFECAQKILQTLKANTHKNQIPDRFSDQPAAPTYASADVTLWYFIAVYEYWLASSDRAFLERIYSFLLQLLMEMIGGTENGVKLDAKDGLLEISAHAKATTWMNEKVGNWLVTPRFGKPVEIQALWYNALMIMLSFSEILDKSAGEAKLRGLVELAEKNIRQIFWLGKAGYLADALTPQGLDSSFRANQVITMGLPFTPFPPEFARAVLDKVSAQLVTPYGLRTLSPFHAAFRGTIGTTPEEKAGAWHNGTVHPWLVWPYVRAALRAGIHPQKTYETFQPLFESNRHGISGHIQEAFEGSAPHKPVGAAASAVSLGTVLQCLAALKKDGGAGSRVKVSLPV